MLIKAIITSSEEFLKFLIGCDHPFLLRRADERLAFEKSRFLVLQPQRDCYHCGVANLDRAFEDGLRQRVALS